MSTRKVTRHEMKHDEFVSSVGQATLWVEHHWLRIVMAAGAAAVAILIGYGIWAWRDSRLVAGEAALASVERAFDAPIGAAGGPGTESFPTAAAKYQAVRERADKVIAEHGSTPAGERARYLRALALFEGGDVAAARQALEEFLDRNPRHFLAAAVKRKIAETYEREKNFDAACERYRALAESPVAELPAEAALLDTARCENARGHREDAVAAYRRIVNEYPDSPYAADARALLLELGQG